MNVNFELKDFFEIAQALNEEESKNKLCYLDDVVSSSVFFERIKSVKTK